MLWIFLLVTLNFHFFPALNAQIFAHEASKKRSVNNERITFTYWDFQ